MNHQTLKLVLLLLNLRTILAIIAFDCGHERLNQTRISLLTVEPCNIQTNNIVQEVEDIQLLQLSEVAPLQIYQCKINILQSVYYCGMFSHLSLVPGGLSTYIADISQEECTKIHQSYTYKLPNGKVLSDIKVNATTHRTEVIAGSVDSQGNCQGTTFTFGTNSWEKVVVIQALEFTITNYISTVHLEDNQVILRNNIMCSYIKGQCIDPEAGMSFWNMISNTSCESLNYDVLYEGNATKVQDFDITRNKTRTVYTVSTGEVIFALETVKAFPVCQHQGFQTEHPRLLITRKTSDNYYFKRKHTNPKNVDLFAYINSKFVYVEHHIKTQIQSLYSHLMNKRCEMEREVLRTQVAVAHYHPAEFAFMRLQEPGYTAVSRGEVIYLIKCQAVETTLRKTERCFNELPVTYRNKSYFMAPMTHLLQEFGTEIPCSSTLASTYFLHGSWFAFSPQGHRIDSPDALKPSNDVPWKYEDPHDLIKSGIYSFDTTEELRRQIMYPSERRAIENVITKALMGTHVDQQNLSINHLIPSDQVAMYLQQTWSIFSTIGNVSATAIAFWFCWRTLKYLINIGVNFYIIKGIYGWNWRMLGAVWNTLTSYLVLKQTQKSQPQSEAHLTAVFSTTDDSQTRDQAPESVTTPATSDPITLEGLRQQVNLYPALQTQLNTL